MFQLLALDRDDELSGYVGFDVDGFIRRAARTQVGGRDSGKASRTSHGWRLVVAELGFYGGYVHVSQGEFGLALASLEFFVEDETITF